MNQGRKFTSLDEHWLFLKLTIVKWTMHRREPTVDIFSLTSLIKEINPWVSEEAGHGA